MAEAKKNQESNLENTQNQGVNIDKNNSVEEKKNNVMQNVLKPSYELTTEEIAKLPKLNVKLVKRSNSRKNTVNYFISVNLSNHVHPTKFISNAADYFLAIDELKVSNYIMKSESNKSSGIDTIYVKDVPVRLLHIFNPEEDKDYRKFNIFLTENSIFSDSLSFSESVLVQKENPKLEFITVGDDIESEDKDDFRF